MSYEYKKQIKDDLKALHEVRKFAEWRAVEMNIDAKCAELDHVYSIAKGVSKHNANYRYLENNVNEILAKAKAFDRIVKESKETFSCGDFCDDVRHIINSYEIGVAKDD